MKELKESINREYGDGTVVSLTDKPEVVDRIPTGSLAIDRMTDGGVPIGRITQIFGGEAVGKTTIAIQTCIEAQKKFEDKKVLIVDTEHAVNPQYITSFGLDPERTLLAQPRHAEEALDLVSRYVESGEISIVVIDSIAALSPKMGVDNSIEKTSKQYAVRARLLSSWVPTVLNILENSQTALVCVNQERLDINVQYGDPNKPVGGKALSYYSSLMLKVRRRQFIKKDDIVKGIRIVVEVVKSKISKPYTKATIDLLVGRGINRAVELLSMALEAEILTQHGAYIKYDGKTLGQGYEKTLANLEADEDLLLELERKVLETEV